jgi:TetR/AcrR family transcriptional repressor of mexJK operon
MRTKFAPIHRTRLRPEQIARRVAAVSREIARGHTVSTACQWAGISVPSYYRWRSQLRTLHSTHEEQSRKAQDLRETIVIAARTVFLRDGPRASVEKIAAEAGVARQTVYNLFGTKERLFSEMVKILFVRAVKSTVTFEEDADLETMLFQSGQYLLKLINHPTSLALLRMSIGHSHEHPDLSAAALALDRSNPLPNIVTTIAQRFHREMEARRMRREDPALAAEAFIGAFCAYPHHRSLLGAQPEPAQLRDERIRLAVRIFLKGLDYTGATKSVSRA